MANPANDTIIKKAKVALVRRNPNQPRKTFPVSSIKELARTIDEHGLLQPIIVRKVRGRAGYELIAGERRLKAVRRLTWKTVPAMVIPAGKVDDHESAQMALVENLMRQDLNPLEEGVAFRHLIDSGESYRRLAKRIGKDKTYIQTRVRLLIMPTDLQQLAEQKPYLLTHCYELNKLKDAKLRAYHISKLTDDKGSKYTLSQLRHELRYAQSKKRENCDDLYALWDYDYLRDPTDGSEVYQGNCNPSVLEKCLKCIYCNTYPKLADKTLWIPFAGSGTGIKTAKSFGLGNVVASDINPINGHIKKLDARKSRLKANSIDIIFAHPPYWNCVQYTKVYAECPDSKDMSLHDNLDDYLKSMDEFFREAKRVMKRNGHLFVMIGDIRKNNRLVPLSANLALIGEKHFILTQIVTKIRKRSSRLMPMLISNAKKRGHLVDITDTILFFRKP